MCDPEKLDISTFVPPNSPCVCHGSGVAPHIYLPIGSGHPVCTLTSIILPQVYQNTISEWYVT